MLHGSRNFLPRSGFVQPCAQAGRAKSGAPLSSTLGTMNVSTPQRWVGALLLAHASINCIAWVAFDQQFSDVRTVASLFLACLFLAPFAGRKIVAMFLTVLAVSYALAALMFNEWGSFVYLVAVCVISLRGYQVALRHP